MNFHKMMVASVALAASTMCDAAPLDQLKAQKPKLFKLYQEGKPYVAALEGYAQQQGFRAPYERLATVAHELVHIQSAIHAGFWINGVYYEPYLNKEAWPSLNNQQVAAFVLPSEQGNIYSIYMRSTPANHLGNVIDELNAHSQVADFVCKNEPESGEKQTRNIIGHLHLQEAYLRATRQTLPAEYMKMVRSKETAGAITTITINSWKALDACGVDGSRVGQQEVRYFMELVSSSK